MTTSEAFNPLDQMSLQAWAEHLVGHWRFSVIPIRPRSKKPALSTWEEYQTRRPTPEELRTWFGAGRGNLAIVCGAVSGIGVIDTDSAEAEEWARKFLTDTPLKTKTHRGWHRFYSSSGAVRNKVHIKTGIPGVEPDVRGDGGYVLAPGSVHPDGTIYLAEGRWFG